MATSNALGVRMTMPATYPTPAWPWLPYGWATAPTRLEAAASLDSSYTGIHLYDLRTSAFDSVYPYNGIHRCTLSDAGVEVNAYGSSAYNDFNNSTGQKMVYIPPFYYYVTVSNASYPYTYTWYISQTGQDTIDGQSVSWTLHPAFLSASKGAYVGAYEGYYNPSTSKLESVAGVQPTVNKNITDFRAAAIARGTGWGIMTAPVWGAIQLLCLIKYGTPLGQYALGQGVVQLSGLGATGTYATPVANYSIDTGATAPLGNNCGIVSKVNQHTVGPVGDVANTWVSNPCSVSPISFHGIENPWGNQNTFVDGVAFNMANGSYPGHVYVADPAAAPSALATTASAAYAAYTDISAAGVLSTAGFTIPRTGYSNTNGEVIDVMLSSINSTYNYLFVPKTVANVLVQNTWIEGFCGAYRYKSSGDSVMSVGGCITDRGGIGWNNVSPAGPFFTRVDLGWTDTNYYTGARLQWRSA